MVGARGFEPPTTWPPVRWTLVHPLSAPVIFGHTAQISRCCRRPFRRRLSLNIVPTAGKTAGTDPLLTVTLACHREPADHDNCGGMDDHACTSARPADRQHFSVLAIPPVIRGWRSRVVQQRGPQPWSGPRSRGDDCCMDHRTPRSTGARSHVALAIGTVMWRSSHERTRPVALDHERCAHRHHALASLSPPGIKCRNCSSYDSATAWRTWLVSRPH
jgi:hypothetical protein